MSSIEKRRQRFKAARFAEVEILGNAVLQSYPLYVQTVEGFEEGLRDLGLTHRQADKEANELRDVMQSARRRHYK